MKGSFIVRWANGLPAAGEPAILILPDGREEKRTTDTHGTVPFEFTPAKSGSYRIGLLVRGLMVRGQQRQASGQMYKEDGSNASFVVMEHEFNGRFWKAPGHRRCRRILRTESDGHAL